MQQINRIGKKSKLTQESIEPWASYQNNRDIILTQKSYIPYYIHQTVDTNYHIIDNPQKQQHRIRQIKPILYNLYGNCIKSSKPKVEETINKSDIHYIQKNKKQLCEESGFMCADKLNIVASKIIKQKRMKKNKSIQDEYKNKNTIEPISYSMIIYYNDNYIKNRRSKNKDISSLLRFKSAKIQRELLKKNSISHTGNLGVYSKEYQTKDLHENTFQKMIKLKNGLRKRNVRIVSESKRHYQNALQEKEKQQKKLSIEKNKKYSNTKSITKKSLKFVEVIHNSSERKNISNKQSMQSKQTKIHEISSLLKPQKLATRLLCISQRNRLQGYALNIEGNKLTER